MLPNPFLAVGNFSSTEGPAWYFDANELPPFHPALLPLLLVSTSTQEKPVQMSFLLQKVDFQNFRHLRIQNLILVLCVACNPFSRFSFFVAPRLRPGDSPGDSPSDAPGEVPNASPGDAPGEVPRDSTGCAPAALPSWDFTFLMSFTSLHLLGS